ncbi:MAG: PEP-CTERM sorting domain-containing protein [bacterium]
MKNTISKMAVIAFSVGFFSTLTSKAETLNLYTTSISIAGGPTSAAILGARWGVWNGTSFTQAVTSSANAGYVDLTGGPETSITLNQTNNNVYVAGTVLAVAIYGNNGVSDSQAVNYSTSQGLAGFKQAVLTNTSWVAPTFNNNATPVSFNFTGATAVVGIFASNTITMVPEPSTYALVALAFVGVMLSFRRKTRA